MKIDLDQFKLHLNTRKIRELTLHFDTPSRRFYLSVIALVVEQMRKNGSNATVPLTDHLEALALLNETVGGGAGSSKEKKLMSRIYRKWKTDLPDLENAPLFKVMGRSKDYGDASGKTYRFDDSAKDAWANLFEYKGSREKVQLWFSVEKLGIRLEDVVIVYGRRSDLGEEKAWNRFIESLRIESLPDGESICISGTASVQLENKLALRHNYLGERSAKNISKTVQAYKVPMDLKDVGANNAFKSPKKKLFAAAAFLIFAGVIITIWISYQRSETVPAEIVSRKTPATASSEMAAFRPLPDKPSIAILPFVNISGDSEENYLSDGITEQIITALSKTPKIFVIARNSVFTYKGKPVKVQQVSKELGVHYVLEGSVQKSGDRLRITAQLIDATTGNHLWAEKYDRELKDIFELEDNIARNVIMALQVKLTEGETARLFGKGTANLEAYLKVQQGIYHVFKWNKADDEIARELYREAIELDPTYSNAYVLLGWTHLHESTFGWTQTPKKSRLEAIEWANKAISLDPASGVAYRLASAAYAYDGQTGKAMENVKKAISLDPNNVDILYGYGFVLRAEGQFDKAIQQFQKAISLDPIPPFYYFSNLGRAFFDTGRSEEATVAFGSALERLPHPLVIARLGSCLVSEGKPQEALYEFDKALSKSGKAVTWVIGNRAIALLGIGKSEDAIKTMQGLISQRPEDPDGYLYLSSVFSLCGKHEEALQMAKKAVDLRHGPHDNLVCGMSHLMLTEYDQAIPLLKKSIQIWPDYLAAHVCLVAAFSSADHIEDARSEVAEIHRINPKYTLEDVSRDGYYAYQTADKERFLSALRKAGLE